MKATIYLAHKMTEAQRAHAIQAVVEEQFSNSALHGVQVEYETSSDSNSHVVVGPSRTVSLQLLAAIDQASM